MKYIRVGAAVSLLLLLGACAGQPQEPAETLTYVTATADPETLERVRNEAELVAVPTAADLAVADEIVCVREKPMGSLISVRRCYTRSQLAEQARSTQDWLSEELPRPGSLGDAVVVVPQQ